MPTQHDEQSSNSEEYHVDSGIASGSQSVVSTIDRRKDKWRTASINKAPPANLASATNAPKMNAAAIKQQLPLKLSSLSSTKPSPNNNSITSPSGSSPSLMNSAGSSGGGGVTQMFPLKLADKKINSSLPNHSRTGSSPAIIQQQVPVQTGNPATRTNTYPKIPERYRLRSSDTFQSPQHHYGSGGSTVHSPSSPLSSSSSHASSHRSPASIHEQQQFLQQQQLYHHHQQQQQQHQYHPQHHSMHTTPLSSRHSSLQSPPPMGSSSSPADIGSLGGGATGSNNNINTQSPSKKDSSTKGKEEEVIYF